MIDILKLYREKSVEHVTEGHKHCRPGWVQTVCPFCSGNPGYHLGFCFGVDGPFLGKFVCWRCGGKNIRKTIATLVRTNQFEAERLIEEYGGYVSAPIENIPIQRRKFKFPGGLQKLMPHHARYLERRGFDPLKIEKEWGITSTGPIAPLSIRVDGKEKFLDFSHRIIIPIEWEGEIVSYQGRDITNRHKLKYLACPKEREIVEHKTILYGKANGKRCVLTEGVTDVWRLGEGVKSCFGIKYRLAQIIQLAKYDEVFLLFDPEPQAMLQAKKIKAELLFRKTIAWLPGEPGSPLPILDSDPGDMQQDDANYLMKQLGFTGK